MWGGLFARTQRGATRFLAKKGWVWLASFAGGSAGEKMMVNSKGASILKFMTDLNVKQIRADRTIYLILFLKSAVKKMLF